MEATHVFTGIQHPKPSQESLVYDYIVYNIIVCDARSCFQSFQSCGAVLA